MQAPPSPRVAWPIMCHDWSAMTFIHWRLPVPDVQAFVPGELTVETFDGAAWVGLTPFHMRNVRVPGLPALPWVSSFPETNLRTYARDSRGRSGIWFFSLDAGLLPAALSGRAGYWLPYHWSSMSVQAADGRLTYRSRRRWPGSPGARCDARVEVGEPLKGEEQDELTHFLTARYRLFSLVAGRLAAADVEHPPWPLHRARLLDLDQDLTRAAGLPDLGEPASVLASPGVGVRVGVWTWLRG
ncbi:YqjF family protein [Thermoactinospora rubra]|uniref:YqjF family protein n=1 Tax=Thermoactinospora rubra TaxID=1088767 RepID=UPI000A110252|nr:DUF2071 domain-containing protein [Thermoactinospora rubra]